MKNEREITKSELFLILDQLWQAHIKDVEDHDPDREHFTRIIFDRAQASRVPGMVREMIEEWVEEENHIQTPDGE